VLAHKLTEQLVLVNLGRYVMNRECMMRK
jgi:hypothetical protein